MDTSKPDMRDAAKTSLKTQAIVFEGQANVYAPRYRHMNMAGLGRSNTNVAPLKKVVHNDVWRAFEHYLQYENSGRPFFLAGHSQGSMVHVNGQSKQVALSPIIPWPQADSRLPRLSSPVASRTTHFLGQWMETLFLRKRTSARSSSTTRISLLPIRISPQFTSLTAA